MIFVEVRCWLLIVYDAIDRHGMVICGCESERRRFLELSLRHTSQNEEILDADDLPSAMHFSAAAAAARPTLKSCCHRHRR